MSQLAELESLAADVEEIEQLFQWAAQHNIRIQIGWSAVATYAERPGLSVLLQERTFGPNDSRLAELLELLRSTQKEVRG